MKVKVLSNLKHDGKLYKAGETVDLKEEEVEVLAGTVENPEAEEIKEDLGGGKKTADMNRNELNEYAKSLGIENPEGFPTKADLLDEISSKEEEAEKA